MPLIVGFCRPERQPNIALALGETLDREIAFNTQMALLLILTYLARDYEERL